MAPFFKFIQRQPVWSRIQKTDLFTFYTVLVLVVFSTLAAGYITSRYLSLRAEIQKHGFDRALVIASASAPKAALSIHDGALALLSRNSAKALASMPEVDGVDTVSIFVQDLQLPNGDRHPVNVLSMTPAFSSTYSLGDPILMEGGVYVPSKSLRKALKLPNHRVQGVLLPSPEFIAGVEQALPVAFRSHFSWDKARLPIQISEAEYSHPSGSERFDTMLFTTALEQTVSVPQITIGSEIYLFIHLAPGFDFETSAHNISTFLKTAVAAEPSMQLSAIPAKDFFKKDFDTDKLHNWQIQLKLGTGLLGLALTLIIAVIKLPGIRYETLLRRAVGCGVNRAVWLSFRPVAYGIFIATLAGLGWASAVVYTNCPMVFNNLLEYIAWAAGFSTFSLVLSYGICYASARSSTLSTELNRGIS